MPNGRRKRSRVGGQYSKALQSLWQVWKVEPVTADPIWQIGQAEHKELAPESIRVGVWNIWKGLGGVLFEHDFRILSYMSDLLLIQEALLSRRSFNNFCGPGFEAVHGASYLRRDALRDGVMTLSRVASQEQRQRIICKYPEPILNTPKAALVTFYPIQGRKERLMVVNLHATLIRGVRRACEELGNLFEQMPAHRGPMILGGDFNTFTPAYLQAVEGALGAFGLVHVKIRDDPRGQFGLLDQIFIRGLRVNFIEVETSLASSDHFPLVCEFSVVG